MSGRQVRPRFKAPRRIIDPTAYGLMVPVRRCPACGTDVRRTNLGMSRHHVLPTAHGGDDVLENLMWLCGQGANGCHGGWHSGDKLVASNIRRYLEQERPDTMAYLRVRVPQVWGNVDAWLERRYPLSPSLDR